MHSFQFPKRHFISVMTILDIHILAGASDGLLVYFVESPWDKLKEYFGLALAKYLLRTMIIITTQVYSP